MDTVKMTKLGEKKGIIAIDKNMTGTHAVPVERVDFSGVFFKLLRKEETELSTQQFTPDKSHVEPRGSKQIPNALICSPEKCLVGSKMVPTLINEC